MILARNQFDQRKYFHPKLKVNFYQVVILSYLRYLSLLFAPSVGNSFWPFSRPSVQTSPPGQYSKLFFITNLRELPPQSDPLWLTNPLPSPPAAPAIISPTTLSATSALPALCGQQIHDELEPDPPLSSVWLSASLSRTLSGDRGSWSRRQMTTLILHFTPGALTGSCQGIKTTS